VTYTPPHPVPRRSCVWSVTDVTECSGGVNVVYVRGKARPGFELTLKVAWRLSASGDGGEVASGHVSCNDVSDAEGSNVWGAKPAVTASVSSAASASGCVTAASLRAAVEACGLPALRDALRRWVETLPAL